MGLKTNLKSMVSDGVDGSVSSKRVVTFISLTLVCIAFVLNLFWNFTVEEYMFNAMMMIVLAGLGATASEKFSGGGKNTNVRNSRTRRY